MRLRIKRENLDILIGIRPGLKRFDVGFPELNQLQKLSNGWRREQLLPPCRFTPPS
jgi:hypothetical protein